MPRLSMNVTRTFHGYLVAGIRTVKKAGFDGIELQRGTALARIENEVAAKVRTMPRFLVAALFLSTSGVGTEPTGYDTWRAVRMSSTGQ